MCSLLFYFIDIVLAGTYFHDGNWGYGVITSSLVIISMIIVQIFSVRWHQMDESMNRILWVVHTFLMGVLHRYFVVIDLYKEAIATGKFFSEAIFLITSIKF